MRPEKIDAIVGQVRNVYGNFLLAEGSVVRTGYDLDAETHFLVEEVEAARHGLAKAGILLTVTKDDYDGAVIFQVWDYSMFMNWSRTDTRPDKSAHDARLPGFVVSVLTDILRKQRTLVIAPYSLYRLCQACAGAQPENIKELDDYVLFCNALDGCQSALLELGVAMGQRYMFHVVARDLLPDSSPLFWSYGPYRDIINNH